MTRYDMAKSEAATTKPKFKKQVAKRVSVTETPNKVKKTVRSKKSSLPSTQNEIGSDKKNKSVTKKVGEVIFYPSDKILEFTKCFEDLKFLDMFFEFSQIHWRICGSKDFEQEASEKIKEVNFSDKSAHYIPLSIRGREYFLFFLSCDQEVIVKFLTKSKRLISFNF
jgi:hypothetical protein